MTDDELPDLTDVGERPCCRYGPSNAPGLRMELRHYPDGTWRFVHRCVAGDGQAVLNAPLLDDDHVVRMAHDPHAEGFAGFPPHRPRGDRDAEPALPGLRHPRLHHRAPLEPRMTDAQLPTLPRALASLAWTLTRWAALLVGCFALASLAVATVALLVTLTITLYAICIVFVVLVLA